MNAEHLRNVVDAVTADNGKPRRVQAQLEALENAFTQSVQAPSAATADAFAAAHESFRSAVETSLCGQLSPADLEILEALGADDLCGLGLLSAVDNIIERKGNPAIA